MPPDNTERETLRALVHSLNNSLNVVTLQAELAQMFLQKGDVPLAQQALAVVLSECASSSQLTRLIYRELAANPDRGTVMPD